MDRRPVVLGTLLGAVLGATAAIMTSASDVVASDTCFETMRGSDFAVMACGYRRFLGLVLSPDAAYVLAGIIGAMMGATLGIAAAHGVARIGRRPAEAQ